MPSTTGGRGDRFEIIGRKVMSDDTSGGGQLAVTMRLQQLLGLTLELIEIGTLGEIAKCHGTLLSLSPPLPPSWRRRTRADGANDAVRRR